MDAVHLHLVDSFSLVLIWAESRVTELFVLDWAYLYLMHIWKSWDVHTINNNDHMSFQMHWCRIYSNDILIKLLSFEFHHWKCNPKVQQDKKAYYKILLGL